MTIGERIKFLRKKNAMTQTDIAKKLNIATQTVFKYEKNIVTSIPMENIQKLSEIFGVTPAYIMGWETEDTEIPRLTNIIPIKTKKIPLLGDIACGKPILCNQEYDLYIDVAEDLNADFCVRAKGDSMINARIFDGDIVFCREQPTVENGEIAVVIIDNEATLKRFYKYENAIELRAENPMQAPLNYSREEAEDIRILGKAIAFQSYVK